jgi:hypothetical protein
MGATLRILSFIFISALLIGPGVAADKVVQVTSESQGDLDPSRLYVVKYKCGIDDGPNRMQRYRRLLSGSLVNGSGTVNVSATINSKTADAAQAATGSTVFTSNILTATFSIFDHKAPEPSCSGQFFVNGSDNYSIVGEAGYTESTSVTDVLSSIATDAIDLTSAFYPLIRMTKPAELDNNINNSKKALTSLESFRKLFTVPPGKGKDSGDLRVGVNWVRALGDKNASVAWLRLDVQPIVGFLQTKPYTRYLIAFGDASQKTPISLAGDNDTLKGRCNAIRQTYGLSGIRDIKDVAYLMYRRLASAETLTREKIVACLGRETALAASDLLKQKSSPLDVIIKDFRITDNDVDTFAPVENVSDQPHTRTTLGDEVSAFASLLGRHLQSNGLRGVQLSTLLADFSSDITVEDTTLNYKVLAALKVNDPNAVSITTKSEDLLSRLKDAGIIRWGCVQATKKDKPDPTFRIYDPKVDSAVMLIAAIAKPDEDLDFNKTPMFGVQLLFEPAAPSESLHIKKMVFETDLRDIILRQNPKCAKNAPKA